MMKIHHIAAASFCFLLFFATSVSAQVAISPSTLNFFSVYKGIPDSISVTVTNNKPAGQLSVTGIHFHHTETYWTNQGPFSLNPGQSISFMVYCDPRHNVKYLDHMVLETSTEAEVLSAFVYAQGKFSKTYYDATQDKWDEALESTLKTLISTGTTDLGYNGARDAMYMQIDNEKINGQGASQNTLECVYTGVQAVGYTSRTDCQNNYNFNTEHTVPQFLFSSNTPMLSDLYHLFPSDANANSERANKPFGMVATPSWTVGGSKSNSSTFEPRDVHKGKAARAVLYFAVRYQDYSGFIAGQQNQLRTWCAAFLPDAAEQRRNDDIFALQHNRNPFIDYPEFFERITLLVGTGNRPNVPLAYLGDDTLTYSVPFPGSQAGYFEIGNQGIDTMHLSNISFSNTEFSLVGSPLLSIPPDSIRRVHVLLSPIATGTTYNETVTFNTDDASQPSMTVHLVGQSLTVGLNAALDNLPTVYPQPSQGRVNLKWDSPILGAMKLELRDLQGRILKFAVAETGSTNFGMNLEGLAPGCYLLHVRGDEGESVHKVILE